jgi:phytanoyl-CoA hydroxylase
MTSINKIGHAMHEYDPVFKAFSDCKEFKNIIYDLGYKKPVLVQSMYIFKQPYIGGAVSPHQDNTFLITNPPTTVGLWIGLEKATKSNGCLWIVPGSHLRSPPDRPGQPWALFKRKLGEIGTYFEPPNVQLSTDGAIPLETEAGTLVVIDGNCVHFSHQNTSPESRHAYTLHVVETQNTTYPIDNWLQRSDGSDILSFPSFS